MSRGKSRTLRTDLPTRYRTDRPGLVWRVDQRSTVGREFLAGLLELWQDLGGYEALSSQERILAERLAFLRQRLKQHEEAVLGGREPLLTPNEHASSVNSLLGLVKALGLKRRAKEVGDLQEYLAASTSEDSHDGFGSDSSD